MSTDVKLFSPLSLRGVTLKNRVAISPMGTYVSENGYIQPFHHAHYANFAMGGAGLVMVEQTSVTRRGRVTNGDPGLWEDGQVAGFRALVSHVKSYGAKIGIQLNHGGRKSSMQRAFRGNGPLTDKDVAMGEEKWIPLAPSALPLDSDWIVPEAMTAEHIEGVRNAWAAAAKRAYMAGFRFDRSPYGAWLSFAEFSLAARQPPDRFIWRHIGKSHAFPAGGRPGGARDRAVINADLRADFRDRLDRGRVDPR